MSEFSRALESFHRFASIAAKLERMAIEVSQYQNPTGDAQQFEQWGREEAANAEEAKRRVRALFEAQERELAALKEELEQHRHELEYYQDLAR